MTFREYEMAVIAVGERHLREEYMCHLEAWLAMKANAKKSAGKNKQKPVYDKFEKFYDYEAEREALLAEIQAERPDRFAKLRKHLSLRKDEN